MEDKQKQEKAIRENIAAALAKERSYIFKIDRLKVIGESSPRIKIFWNEDKQNSIEKYTSPLFVSTSRFTDYKPFPLPTPKITTRLFIYLWNSFFSMEMKSWTLFHLQIRILEQKLRGSLDIQPPESRPGINRKEFEELPAFSTKIENMLQKLRREPFFTSVIITEIREKYKRSPQLDEYEKKENKPKWKQPVKPARIK